MIGNKFILDIEGFYGNGNFKTKVISFQKGKDKIIRDLRAPSISLIRESNEFTCVRTVDNHSFRFVELIKSGNILPKILVTEEWTFRGNIVRRTVISFLDVQMFGYARRNYASKEAEDTITFYSKENQWRYI